MNVVGYLSTVLSQGVTNVDRQRQTDVTVHAGTVIKHGFGHGLQAGHQTVILCYVSIGVGKEGLERYLRTLELMILSGGLVAGVGHVEHVVLLLRVEHQLVLPALLHRLNQLTSYLLVLFLPLGGHACQVATILGQFRPQYL